MNKDSTETPMTKTNMDLWELMAKHDQGDFLRSTAEAVLELIMDADADGLIGVGRQPGRHGRGRWRLLPRPCPARQSARGSRRPSAPTQSKQQAPRGRRSSPARGAIRNQDLPERGPAC